MYEFDSASYCITAELKKLPNLQIFTHPALQKLKKWDFENGTQYLETLYEFLLCGGNFTNTALRLDLHRNTVIYRISKIEELIDVDIYNMENVKLLLLSYLIMKIA